MKPMIVIMASLILLAAATVALASSGYDLWANISGSGGGTSSGGSFTVSGSVGQADTSTSSSGSFTVASGFWSGAELTPTPTPTATPTATATRSARIAWTIAANSMRGASCWRFPPMPPPALSNH